jgi:hypothetical protein
MLRTPLSLRNCRVNDQKHNNSECFEASPEIASAQSVSTGAARQVVTDEMSVKQHAERLASTGHVRAAAGFLNTHLANHDAGWGLWNSLAVLSRRIGRYELAVAAHRASARQLEEAGHLKHAYAELRAALRLAPNDHSVRHEVSRLSRMVRVSPPKLRVVPAAKSTQGEPKPASTPTSGVRRALEFVTDPHLAIFEILDQGLIPD